MTNCRTHRPISRTLGEMKKKKRFVSITQVLINQQDRVVVVTSFLPPYCEYDTQKRGEERNRRKITTLVFL